MELRSTFIIPENDEVGADMLFADYLESWLEIAKSRIKIATYSSYSNMIKGTIAPYFRKKKITLRGLDAKHIQQFYTEELERVSPNTVIHYHANIHSALKYAVKTDLIPVNPADKVDRPKKNSFTPNFYDSNELEKLFSVSKGHKLELPILFGAFYGLRRGEVLGLKWDAFDFEKGTITIKRTVTSCIINGELIQIEQESQIQNPASERYHLSGSSRNICKLPLKHRKPIKRYAVTPSTKSLTAMFLLTSLELL